MLYQYDKEFDGHPIKKSGCYMLDLIKACEILTGKEFSHSDIITIYDYALGKKYIEKDCSVTYPDDFCKYVLALCGEIKKRIYQVGGLKDGKVTYWPWIEKDPTSKFRVIDFFNLRYATGAGGKHYVLADSTQKIIHDPYEGHYSRLWLIDGLAFHIEK